jgi:hypothetical protein
MTSVAYEKGFVVYKTVLYSMLSDMVSGTFTIDPTNGYVNVKGGVKIPEMFTSFYFRFGEVTGDFDCTDCNITSLEGAPKKVGGSFYCSYANIESLEGAPKEVGGSFDCRGTSIVSLEGAPKEVGDYFDCAHTKITSLKGAPTKIGGNLICNYTQIDWPSEKIPESLRGKIEH